MSQTDAAGKKGRKRDRFQRMLGIRPRGSPPIGSDTSASSSVTALAPAAAQSLPLNGGNSPRQSRERIPSISAPERPGDLGVGFAAPAPHPVARSPALPLSSSGLDTAPGPQAEAMSDKNEAGNLWGQALGSLSEKDKNTLEASKTGSKLDIEELLVAAKAKRDICLKNQWEFEFRGRAVNLRYQADKIISWLAKFKEVGDMAIQYDPSHAALPWAGIRFLLQVIPSILFNIGC